MKVRFLFRIPKKQYRKVLEKHDNIVDAIVSALEKYNVTVREVSVGGRYAKYIIEMPTETYYELQSRGSVEALIEKKLIEKLKLKQSGIYIFPFKPKYKTRYIAKKYQHVALWKHLHEKILKYSKEENMTINEFIKYLIELYEQLKEGFNKYINDLQERLGGIEK